MVEKCEICPFWDNSTQQQHRPDESGVCRVNPPVADDRDGTARWPFTSPEDWCAAHPSNRSLSIGPTCVNSAGCIKGGECTKRNECLYGEMDF